MRKTIQVTATRESIAQDALLLAAGERARVVPDLLDSLRPDAVSIIDDKFAVELDRRFAD